MCVRVYQFCLSFCDFVDWILEECCIIIFVFCLLIFLGFFGFFFFFFFFGYIL